MVNRRDVGSPWAVGSYGEGYRDGENLYPGICVGRRAKRGRAWRPGEWRSQEKKCGDGDVGSTP